MTRVGIAGLWHETNTYSSKATELVDFAAFELLAGEDILGAHQGTGSVIGGMLDIAGIDYVPIATAGAWPAGRVTAATLEELLGRLRDGLAAAGELDAVLLDLHGAMVAEGCDDVELETATLVREVIGDRPLVAVHDLHANPSQQFVSRCDALVGYDTYPHVDMRDRGREAAELLTAIMGGSRMRTMVRKIPVLISPLRQGTDSAPMIGLKKRAAELQSQDGMRRISLFPGFPYSDVARAGFSVVVVFLEGAGGQADEVGRELADAVEFADWSVQRPDPKTAVAEAIASTERPVVLADVADNIGGGSPGDGTALLAELLAQGAEGAVVSLADAEVAGLAHQLGRGGTLAAEVGAKTDGLHGEPVFIEGKVVELSDGVYRTEGTWQTGRSFSMGRTAVLEVDGVTLEVMERPTPPFHREHLTSVGIDPASASIIVAKGALAWRSAYGDVAARVVEVDAPGICPVDPHVLPRSTDPMRA
ncbi:MAG: M81 family metallopeptidase [Acidimicrobiia bacterium]